MHACKKLQWRGRVYQGIINMPDSRISVISDVVKTITLIQETVLSHHPGQLVDPELGFTRNN